MRFKIDNKKGIIIYMKSLLLIDANSLIHRCFHALPPLNNPKSQPVGAIYGVSSVLLKILNQRKPDYIAALFDRPEPTFRKERYDQYKAQRPKAPDELISQLIEAHNLFDAFSIKTFESPGFEADDLIGTMAKKFGVEKNILVTILTGDLDSLQLVKDGEIVVETFKKGISETIEYDRAGVIERYGLEPEQLIDYKALVGDQSDNIPGVLGIGQKTASIILQKYKTLDGFLKKGKKEKIYEKINNNREIALLSQELAKINTEVPIDTNLENLMFQMDRKKILEFLAQNGFSSLIKRIPKSLIQQTETPQEQNLFNGKNDADKNLLFLDPDDHSFLEIKEDDFNSETKIKISWDLKNAYKFHPFTSPYFDVSLGYQLLGIDTKDQDILSLNIFKKEMSKKDFVLDSYSWIKAQIKKRGLLKVFDEIETPLIPVLANMEIKGIKIDLKELDLVTKKLEKEIDKKRENIITQIGKDINLNSPKQLLDYFQNDLKLKIKSTGADVIEKIKEKNPLPIFDKLLEYRELFKIKTTYLDAFKRLVFKDERIHPTFLQLGASTGRLSCQNPNLQNIPQESEWSKEIRNIFIPEKNNFFVSFDYSQIELRVIAFLTQDKNMVNTFKTGGDIHTMTASKIFGVSINDVNQKMRRTAKTLNFGMMYGMGYRALAQSAKISQDEAKDFIKRYFEEFSSVKDWQQNILEEARKTGISKNINGRQRDVSSIHSPNPFLSSGAEREAINMPSQSLAADILKLAMKEVDFYIKKNKKEDIIKMLLTIHDELVFEVDKNEIENNKDSQTITDIKNIMESVYALGFPLVVDCKIGKRWGEMK